MAPQKNEVLALWKKYLKTRSDDCRNALVENYAPLVHIQAARLSRKLPAQIGYDEICSAGYDGLIEAVQSYVVDARAQAGRDKLRHTAQLFAQAGLWIRNRCAVTSQHLFDTLTRRQCGAGALLDEAQ